MKRKEERNKSGSGATGKEPSCAHYEMLGFLKDQCTGNQTATNFSSTSTPIKKSSKNADDIHLSIEKGSSGGYLVQVAWTITIKTMNSLKVKGTKVKGRKIVTNVKSVLLTFLKRL